MSFLKFYTWQSHDSFVDFFLKNLMTFDNKQHVFGYEGSS